MEAKHNLLRFARTVNDHDDRLPKGRGDCFDVGIWGGCGIYCPVFTRGECKIEDAVPFVDEIKDKATVEEIKEIKEMYPDVKEFKQLY